MPTKIIEEQLDSSVAYNPPLPDDAIVETSYEVTDVLPHSSHPGLGDHVLFIRLMTLTFRRALLSRNDHNFLFVIAPTISIIGRARHRLPILLLWFYRIWIYREAGRADQQASLVSHPSKQQHCHLHRGFAFFHSPQNSEGFP